MTLTSKREVARILRMEAEKIRLHGFTNFFSHSFNCVQAQVLRADRCEGCLLRDHLPEKYREEVFPCQHIDPDLWAQLEQIPGLAERMAARFMEIAGELEKEALREESVPAVARG